MTASRLGIWMLLTGGMLVGVSAQAQQPPPASKSTAAASQSAAPTGARSSQQAAAVKATEAQPARTVAARQPADPSAQLLTDARNAGFKPTQIRGTLMFCRVAIELGSNFPVRTCYNEQQTKVKLAEYQAQRDQLRQGRFIPPGMAAGCSPRSCQ